MPLFRFHRGSLEESLQTTIIVHSKMDLIKIFSMDNCYGKIIPIEDAQQCDTPIFNCGEKPKQAIEGFSDIEIEPYPSLEECFDPRCGWFTHAVYGILRGKRQIVGILSEDFE